MGRNKDLRERIAGWQRVIEAHEEKIQEERSRPHPSDDLIGGWQREIETQRRAIARAMRRLKREW